MIGIKVTDLTPLARLTGRGAAGEHLGGSRPAPLAGLTAPTKLSLAVPGIVDLTPLAGLTGLRELWLIGTGVPTSGP